MLAGVVNPLNQLTFVIALPKHQAQAEIRTSPVAALLDLRERGVTIDMWLARAQQIQVRTIQNVDAVQCDSPMRSIGNERPQTGRQM